MNVNVMPLIGICAALSLTACKQDAASNAQSDSQNLASTGTVMNDALKASGCSVTQLANGARIDCGESSATILNGSNGSNGSNGTNGVAGAAGAPGTNGLQGLRGPAGASAPGSVVLLDGDGVQVGDMVISANADIGYNQARNITIYDSAMDGLVVYQSGKIVVSGQMIGFSSNDCSGKPYSVLAGGYDIDEATKSTVAQGNYIRVVGDKAYRVETTLRNAAISSHYFNGECLKPPFPGFHVVQNAKEVPLTVPLRLKNGYSISVSH